MIRIQFLALGAFILWSASIATQANAQPIGSNIAIDNFTLPFDELGYESRTASAPVLLGNATGDERFPVVSTFNDGSATVFWINRAGTRLVNGVDPTGKLLKPTILEDAVADIIIGASFYSSTDITLNVADRLTNRTLVGGTYLAATIDASAAAIPDTIGDVSGVNRDDVYGHAFVRILNENLEPVSEPISVGQFTLGHSELAACWLWDGKFAIATVSRGREFADDPDFPQGGDRVVSLNLFNPDGSRFADEFFIEDLTGQQYNIHLAPLGHGFVLIYFDDKNFINGTQMYKGIIFDNDGNMMGEFIASDLEHGIGIGDLASAGGGSFITVTAAPAPAGIGLPPSIVGRRVILAQRWNEMGGREGPYILVTSHDDFRTVSRPRVAMARNGTFVCSWTDTGADFFDFVPSLVARVFNSDGMPSTPAFVAHPVPEFLTDPDNLFSSTGGGAPNEPTCGISNETVVFSWGSTAAPEARLSDIAFTMILNNAEGTSVLDWSIYTH